MSHYDDVLSDLKEKGPRDLDISIIKLDVGNDSSLPFLQIKEPSILNLYSEIALCGYPSGESSFSFKGNSTISSTRFSPVMQFGRISGLMPVDVSTNPYAIQTDIIGTAGSSGSPIVDPIDACCVIFDLPKKQKISLKRVSTLILIL